jgi:hypothetical protein
MEQAAYTEQQYPQVDQPEAGGMGMPEAEAAPMVDTPAPEQLPPAMDGVMQEPEVTMPESVEPEMDAGPAMDGPYETPIEDAGPQDDSTTLTEEGEI